MPSRNVCEFCGEIVDHTCAPQPSSFGEINKEIRALRQAFEELGRIEEQLRVGLRVITDD